MKKYIFLFLLVFISFVNAGAQVIRWKGTYGGLSHEYGYSCVQTYDKGYIAVGSTGSYSSSMDVYLFKTDSAGRMEWSKNIGGPNIDVGRSIIQTADTGYVIAGYTNNTITGYDVFIVKTDRHGDTLWTKTYGGTDWDFAYSVYETYDSGFVVAGGTYSYGAGDEDFYLLRLNKLGDTLWTKTYGGTNEDEAACVIESSEDSGFVMVGKTKSFADIMGSAYVIKTNKNGMLIASEEYGGSANDYLTSIVEAEFIRGYIAVGGSASYGTDEDVYMMRMNYLCDTIWTKTENAGALPSEKDVANGVAISQHDKSFVFVGITTSGAGYEDVYFFKFDSTGYYKAATTHGTYGHDIAYSVFNTNDSGFIFCGQTDTTSNGFAQFNVLLVKTDSNGLTAGPFLNSIKSYGGNKLSININPNPVTYHAIVHVNSAESFNVAEIGFRVNDLTGKEAGSIKLLDITKQQSTHSMSVPITLENIASGVYILEVYNNVVLGRIRFVKN